MSELYTEPGITIVACYLQRRLLRNGCWQLFYQSLSAGTRPESKRLQCSFTSPVIPRRHQRSPEETVPSLCHSLHQAGAYVHRGHRSDLLVRTIKSRSLWTGRYLSTNACNNAR